jgi:hypothetical protein
MLYLAGALGIHLNSPWTGCYFAENLSSRRLLISHYSLEYFRPIKILITDPAKHLVPPAQKHFYTSGPAEEDGRRGEGRKDAKERIPRRQL